ncbi:hypothetical protein BJ912DRAFT_229783 [Pholiota molesta]|nr:hypothetical protein BJ912DRAFT_229783 [Pholiota molesta]
MEEGKTYPFMQGENGPRIYRMTLDVVGRSLTDFQSSYQFISAIADAMEAHDVAIFDCGVLHHDISIGSIILTDDHGVLIDWDLCAKLDDDNENNLPIARRPTCIGMWQFMSAMLLTNPFIRRSYHDDRESAFYVLLWIGLRCTKTEAAPGSTYTPENVLRGFDELFIDSAGRHLGGDRKTVVLRRYRKEGIMFIECPELDSLLAELAPVFDVRYESKPTAKDMAHLKKLLTKLEVANSEDEKQSIQEILHYHVTYRYQQKMEKLEKSGWLVDTIRKYLHLGK